MLRLGQRLNRGDPIRAEPHCPLHTRRVGVSRHTLTVSRVLHSDSMDPISTRRWRALRAALLNTWHAEGRTCVLRLPGCTTVVDSVDHIVPRSLGGAVFDRANCQPSCRRCNQVKGDRIDYTPQPAIRQPTRQSRSW